MALAYSRSEVKERSRAEWRGCCNVLMPSYSSDFRRLNEAGIRHDVRKNAQFGFWGTLVASECGTSVDEYIRFMEIAADEAPENLKLVTHLSFDTVEDAIRVAGAAEVLRFEAALLSYPPTFSPRTANEIVEWTRHMSEQTDLAIILFAVANWGFRSISPAQFPPEALYEMARFETAAAIKYEAAAPGMISGLADVLRKCGDQVIVECPMEQYAPGLVEWFGMQWIGTSAYDSFGDRVPRWFDLLHEGCWDEAMDLYWSYQPIREAKGAFHQSFAGAGIIHRNGWKYMNWLHGYNGGLLRMPSMRLNPGQMKSLRQGMIASGYDVPENDDAFRLGRHPEE